MNFKIENVKELMGKSFKKTSNVISETVSQTKENAEKLSSDIKKIKKVNKIKTVLKNLASTDNLTLQYEAYLNIAEEMRATKEKAEETLQELRNDIKNIANIDVMKKYGDELEEYKKNKGEIIGLRQLRKNLIRLEEIKTEQTEKDFKNFNKKAKEIEKEVLKVSKLIKRKIEMTEKQLEQFEEFEKRIGQVGLIDALVSIEETYEIIPNECKKKREELIQQMKINVEKVSESILKFIWDATLSERSNRVAKMMNAEEEKLYKNIELVKQTSEKIILTTKDKMFLIVKNEDQNKIDLLLIKENQLGEQEIQKFDESAETIQIEKFVENFA